jgi:PPK2 family polyphosphate:nucleotide phosphotransferase
VARAFDRLLVKPGEPAGLAARDPATRLGLAGKAEAGELVRGLVEELFELQARLAAEATRAVLLVLQGLDTSGKDGTIRRVFRGLNPQGCRVTAFKSPSEGELAHDYLWRVHAVCPARGEIGIFNRSHYEDLVTVRVKTLATEEVWRRRFRHVREFERALTDEGTTVLKVFLHISRGEQRRRLQSRLEDPAKMWKFRPEDLADRRLWHDFMTAYDETLTETSTEWAPWHVVPADRKWVRDAAVATLLVETLRSLDPRSPPPPAGLEAIVVE